GASAFLLPWLSVSLLSCCAIFLSLVLRRPPIFTLFPYTTLFRSSLWLCERLRCSRSAFALRQCVQRAYFLNFRFFTNFERQFLLDRKSTRLNSSHVSISYAVFCLKKKNN